VPSKAKKSIQGSGGSRKKLAATHRAKVALPKGYGRQEQGKKKTVPRTHAGQTFGKRRQVKLEGLSGTRNQGLRKQLCLSSKRTLGKIFGKTVRLEIVKQSRLRKMSDEILWRGQPTPKGKRRLRTE
jgi:hypothetical protein